VQALPYPHPHRCVFDLTSACDLASSVARAAGGILSTLTPEGNVFGRVARLLAVLVLSTSLHGAGLGQCGTRPVKTGTDAGAAQVSTVAVATTIAVLRSVPALCHTRFAPVERSPQHDCFTCPHQAFIH
jgi:hypothetical protein